MIVRETARDEKKRVDQLFAIAFEMADGTQPGEEEDETVYHWAAFEDGTGNMMSTLSISDYEIRFDWGTCKMGGIGGVASLPQYRRQGGIRGCFQSALPWMYEHGYEFSYLYPFSTAYYRKFGYECCVQKLACSVDLGLLKPGEAAGHFFLTEAHRPMTEAIRAIDRAWESRYNMMVIHDDAFYDWTRQVDPAKKQEFTYVYLGADGSPRAYTTFRLANQPDGRNLQCSRFFFLDREGFNGLMHLFKSLSSDHRYVKFELPNSCSMEYLMPEWSMGAAQWSVCNAGMVRVINVEKALWKCHCHGAAGTLTIAVRDPQIPQNNDTFTVVWKDGHVTGVERTQVEPDAVLDITAFSSLLCGVTDLSQAELWMKGVEVLHPEHYPSLMFYRKPMMIADYF